MSILTMSMPSGRTLAAPFKTISQAARMVRDFASSRGVSPLAIDWSVSRAFAIPAPAPVATPHLDALVARLDAAHPNGAWPGPVRPGTDHLPTFGKAPKPGRWP